LTVYDEKEALRPGAWAHKGHCLLNIKKMASRYWYGWTYTRWSKVGLLPVTAWLLKRMTYSQCFQKC